MNSLLIIEESGFLTELFQLFLTTATYSWKFDSLYLSDIKFKVSYQYFQKELSKKKKANKIISEYHIGRKVWKGRSRSLDPVDELAVLDLPSVAITRHLFNLIRSIWLTNIDPDSLRGISGGSHNSLTSYPSATKINFVVNGTQYSTEPLGCPKKLKILW